MSGCLFAGYEAHPAAELFPLMDGAELQALADDIKAHGLRNPIVLYGNGGEQVILDGRNRIRACELAGVTPSFAQWDGTGSPAEWVVSQNLHRRHLNTSQRGMVAVGLMPFYRQEAREREIEGGHGKGSANVRDPGKAASKAAAALNVSTRTVEAAAKVTQEAPPEVVEAVKAGKVAVSAAAKALPFAPRGGRAKKKTKKSVATKNDPTCLFRLTLPASLAAKTVSVLQRLGFRTTRHPSATRRDMYAA